MADLLMAMVHGAGTPSAASLSCLASPPAARSLLAWKHVRDLPWGVLIAVGIRFSSMPQLPSFAENSVPLSVAQACTLLPGGGAAQKGTGGSWGQRSPRSAPLWSITRCLYTSQMGKLRPRAIVSLPVYSGQLPGEWPTLTLDLARETPGRSRIFHQNPFSFLTIVGQGCRALRGGGQARGLG